MRDRGSVEPVRAYTAIQFSPRQNTFGIRAAVRLHSIRSPEKSELAGIGLNGPSN